MRAPTAAATSTSRRVHGGGTRRPARPRPWSQWPPGRRGSRPSQLLGRAGRLDGFLGGPFPAVTFTFGHRLVDGRFEVVAKVIAEFLAHLLHEAGHAAGIVLVEIAIAGG